MTEFKQLIELADKTAETRRDTHVQALVEGLKHCAGDAEDAVAARRRIYSGLAFVDDESARMALLNGLEHEPNTDVVSTLVQSYWRQARFVRQDLPELVQKNWEAAPDARFTQRLIDVMRTHRIIEKIDPSWRQSAPDELVALVSPRPLWA